MHNLSFMNSLINVPRILQIYRRMRRKLSPFRKAVTDVCREDFCAVYINWNPPSRRWDTMTRLHWCVTRAVWSQRKFYALLSALVWPGRAFLLSMKMTRRYGPRIKARTGLGLARQFIQQFYLAMRHFITPRAYYFYGLHEPERRKRSPFYVQDHEISFLLRPANGDADYTALDDKRLFISKCRGLGLPVIPIICEFEGGKLTRSETAELPHSDLFAKPALGRCANGAALYRYVGDGLYQCGDGSLKSGQEVLKELAERSQKDPYILQKRLLNHPEISALSPRALCTARVITCRFPEGRCEDIVSIFKLPTGNNFADNFSIGGIAIAINKDTGVLGSGLTKSLDAERTDYHPDTGVKIAGFRIPFWDEAIKLCLEAHAAFPSYAFVGWDVAVTEDGPVLVEGNLPWGVESLQRGHCRGLGETTFPGAVISHISRCKFFGSLLRRDFWVSEKEILNYRQGGSGYEDR